MGLAKLMTPATATASRVRKRERYSHIGNSSEWLKCRNSAAGKPRQDTGEWVARLGRRGLQEPRGGRITVRAPSLRGLGIEFPGGAARHRAAGAPMLVGVLVREL